MSFANDVSSFINKTGIRGDKVFKKIGFQGLSGVMKKTRVDKGTLRGNWRVGINQADTESNKDLINSTPEGQTDGSAVSQGSMVIAGAELGNDIVISNSMPYAQEQEDKNNMIERTVKEIKYGIKKAL